LLFVLLIKIQEVFRAESFDHDSHLSNDFENDEFKFFLKLIWLLCELFGIVQFKVDHLAKEVGFLVKLLNHFASDVLRLLEISPISRSVGVSGLLRNHHVTVILRFLRFG